MTQDEEDLRADWRDDVASGSTELSFLTWAEERKLGAEFERSCQWRSFDVTLVECTEIRYELGTREAFTPEQAFKDA